MKIKTLLYFIDRIFTSKYDSIFPVDIVEVGKDKKYVYNLLKGLVPWRGNEGVGVYISWEDFILRKGWKIFVPQKIISDILWKYDKIKYFKYQINSIKYRFRIYKNKYKQY